MPRLSVDIDLMYLPVKSRADSLTEIDAAMKRIAERIKAGIPASRTTNTVMEGAITKLLIQADGVQVKIELSPVMRGTVGFEAGTPDWSLLRVAHAAELPAVLWRQRNLETRTPEQRAELVANLRRSLSVEQD